LALTAMALHESALTFKLIGDVAAITAAFDLLGAWMVVGHVKSLLMYRRRDYF